MRFRAGGTYDMHPDALSRVLLKAPIPLKSNFSRVHTSFSFRTKSRFSMPFSILKVMLMIRSGIHNSHLTHKPQAVLDVIPRRASHSNPLDHNLFSKHVETDEATAAKLMDNLLQILDRITQTLGVWLKSAVGLWVSFCAVLSLYQYTYRFQGSRRRNTI